jgi:predicted MPP superfamily phosphohydrolase
MKKVTIIQFSDMHISSVFPSNRAFVSSILADIKRQKVEEPPISKPNMLILCGDVIQGVDRNLPIKEASQLIRKQYQKAEDVLNQFSGLFTV